MNRRKALQQTALVLGGAVSASIIAGVMSGCKPTKSIDWQPAFLTKDQAILVGELAETILPETDTPGAKSLHVPEFIDLIVKDSFSGFEQLQFTKGLTEIENKCQFFAGKSFMDCPPKEQQDFLLLQEQEGIKARQQAKEKPFIFVLKELVVTGYFTSEYVVTELMNYNPIPQKFDGCVPMANPKVQIGIQGRSA